MSERAAVPGSAASQIGHQQLAPAFELALVASGTPALGHLAKRNIHVHLHLLAQLGEREILDPQALTRKASG